MKWKNRPCTVCREQVCSGTACGKWKAWFMDAWGAVNRYAWAEMDEAGRQEERVFRYGLPHEDLNPCKECGCRAWCDKSCARRIKWWDAAMGRIRRRMGGSA